MDNILEKTLTNNKKEINVLNDINLDLSLSFNNISYTLLHENNNNIINNSILFNIEDTENLYNIFIENKDKFSYQLNNILYINNEKNIYLLNYNLLNTDNFKIIDNNIEFNILDNNLKNKQNIYSYNYNNFSYIYSNCDNLDKLNFKTNGLYKFNEDFNCSNNKVSLNLDQYNYNIINNLIKNYNDIIKRYNDNINLFPDTDRFSKIYYSNNISLISNTNIIYENYKIYYKDNKYVKEIENNLEYTIVNNNDKKPYKYINQYLYKMPIASDKYFIIDIPIIYEYNGYVNSKLNYMPEIYNININKFIIKIENNLINNYYISFNKDKSYIYDYTPIDINLYNENILYNFYKIRILLRACLYFDIDSNIYEEIYNKIYGDVESINNIFNLSIKYEDKISYNFKLLLDCSGNIFKKLYHNYNYGFNFNGYGECIGLLLYPHQNNNFNNTNQEFQLKNHIIQEGLEDSINDKQSNFIVNINNKDLFINFSEFTLDDIFIKHNVNITSNDQRYIPNCNKVVVSTIKLDTSKQINMSIDGSNYTIINQFKIEDYNSINIDNIQDTSFLYLQNNLYTNNINYIYQPDIYSELTIDGINLNRYIYFNCHDTTYNWIGCEYEYSCVYDPNFNDQKRYISTNSINWNSSSTSFILSDNIIYSNKNDNIYGKFKLISIGNNNDIISYNTINNQYIIDHDLNNRIFPNIYNYRKSGQQYGDNYIPCMQNYMMIRKFNIVNYFNEDIYSYYMKYQDKYYLFSSNFKKSVNDIEEYCCYNNKNYAKNFLHTENINNINNEDWYYTWPVYNIPDFSIINSDNYYIIFNEEENCEYIDYYINKNQKEICLNIREYLYNKHMIFNFMSDNKFVKINNSINNYIDKENDIIQLKIKINRLGLSNNNIINIFYKDKTDYLNNYKINNEYYRILCKISLKIDNN